MIHLNNYKIFKEELKSSTYDKAAEKLKNIGHDKRSVELKKWAEDIRIKEIAKLKKFEYDESSKLGMFDLNIDGVSVEALITLDWDISEFRKDLENWVSDGNVENLDSKNYRKLFLKIGIGIIDNDTLPKNVLKTSNLYPEDNGIIWIPNMSLIIDISNIDNENFKCELFLIQSKRFRFDNRKSAIKFRKVLYDILMGNIIFKETDSEPGIKEQIFDYLCSENPDYLFTLDQYLKMVNSIKTASVNQLYND